MEISYVWNRQRFFEASKANYHYHIRSWKFRAIGYLGLLFILIGCYLAYTKSVYATLGVATFLTIYWHFLRWPFYQLQLSYQFKKHCDRDQHIKWVINEETFSISSENGSGTYKWHAVTGISETEKGFLVRKYPIYYWIPKDCFASQAEIEWFKENIIGKFQEK